jgi:hypothetical protein
MGSDMSNLLVWDSAVVPNGCVLGEHSELEDSWEFLDGVSRAETFPTDFTYSMHPDFPHDTLLVDNLINTDMMTVVSPALRSFLESWNLTNVEYLPTTILDHRGRPAGRNYCVVHPINPVDCLDLAKSGARFSAIDAETVEEIKQLVVDESRLDPTRRFFRPKGFYRATLVTKDLAAAIDKQGFRGIRWIELDAFRG